MEGVLRKPKFSVRLALGLIVLAKQHWRQSRKVESPKEIKGAWCPLLIVKTGGGCLPGTSFHDDCNVSCWCAPL